MLIKRTKPISPSKIGVFSSCKLRYLLETEGAAVNRLSAGPVANIGTAVHESIEALVACTELDIGSVRKVLVGKLLEQFSSPEKSSKVASVAFERFGLKGVVRQVRLLLLCSYIKDVLGRMPSQTGIQRLADSSAQLRSGQIGIEKWVKSESLSMAGRVDYSYFDESGCLHVVDFKTGQVADDKGLPKAEYELQVAAYASMLRDAVVAHQVRLHLEGPSGNWEGDLTPELENRVRYAAREINRSLPFDKVFEAREMASIGEHCRYCSVRPGCAKYLDRLMVGDVDSPSVIADGDLHGTVIESGVADGLVKVRLECHGTKRVTITGIPEILWHGEEAVCMFALRTREVSGRARYIANYHVLDVCDPQSSAFEYLAIPSPKLHEA